MELHLVVRNQRVRVGKPLIQQPVIPSDLRGLERLRIPERRYAPRLAPIDVAQPWARHILIERVASAAALLEELLAAVTICDASSVLGRAIQYRKGNQH